MTVYETITLMILFSTFVLTLIRVIVTLLHKRK